MYKSSDKISELMSHEEDAIQIISRFGLETGVGEQTISEACEVHHVDTPTFLSVVNYKVFHQRAVPEEIDLPTLQRYLLQAHTYFLDFRLPLLRRALTEAIMPQSETDARIPRLIIRCFDEFVEEIRTHIEHENEGRYDEHEHDDQRITDKLTEIKNLIIKYYKPSSVPDALRPSDSRYVLISVMSDLWHTELDFADHCSIEDDILRPALAAAKGRMPKGHKSRYGVTEPETAELSDRERDVLVQVVRGLSNKEIADVLCISTHTVISHRKNIVRKLNIHSSAGLTIYALVNKLIDLNSVME